jgi:hypothetical protein
VLFADYVSNQTTMDLSLFTGLTTGEVAGLIAVGISIGMSPPLSTIASDDF